jgi:hypothetical protein
VEPGWVPIDSLSPFEVRAIEEELRSEGLLEEVDARAARAAPYVEKLRRSGFIAPAGDFDSNVLFGEGPAAPALIGPRAVILPTDDEAEGWAARWVRALSERIDALGLGASSPGCEDGVGCFVEIGGRRYPVVTPAELDDAAASPGCRAARATERTGALLQDLGERHGPRYEARLLAWPDASDGVFFSGVLDGQGIAFVLATLDELSVLEAWQTDFDQVDLAGRAPFGMAAPFEARSTARCRVEGPEGSETRQGGGLSEP